MKFEKDYSPFDTLDPTKVLGDKIALNHFAQHLGETRWQNLLHHASRGNIPSKEYFRDLCAIILEIEGRPVEAFIRTFLSTLPDRADLSFVVETTETVEIPEIPVAGTPCST